MKSIVITGAGKGMGEATVREIIARKESFSKNGEKLGLVITSRTRTDLLPLQSLARDHGIECEILPLELTDAPTKPIDLAFEHFGSVDILIHAAGVMRWNPLLKATEDDLNFVMKTNVHATFLLVQAAYAKMKAQKKGHIVLITSIAAERAFKESAIYCMSKYAQRGLIDVLRLYGYEDGIKITDVKPGSVVTPIWGDLPQESKDRMMTAQSNAQCIVDVLLVPGNTSVESLTIRPVHGDF